MEYVIIGIGGILGALSRYAFSKWVGQRWRGDFPLATFFINITGSFIMGVLYVLFSRAGSEFVFLKNLATTGFLGAFTTYSTFSYEIISLIEDREKAIAVIYFSASLIVGLLSAYAGIILAEHL